VISDLDPRRDGLHELGYDDHDEIPGVQAALAHGQRLRVR
jgi:hypothetical protein